MKIDFCKNIELCKVAKIQPKETLRDPKAESDSICLVENSSNYFRIDFENCVYKDVQSDFKKCDYGIETQNEIYFIELKGQDNNEGMRQLLATIEETKHCFTSIDKKNGKVKRKKANAILVVSKIQTPKNLDKKLYKNLTLQLGEIPIVAQRQHKLVI